VAQVVESPLRQTYSIEKLVELMAQHCSVHWPAVRPCKYEITMVPPCATYLALELLPIVVVPRFSKPRADW
jgi:hypothetical protein